MNKNDKLPGIIIFWLTFFMFCGFFALTIAPSEDTAVSGGLKMVFDEDTDGHADEDHLIMTEIETDGDPDSVKVIAHYYRDSIFHTVEMKRLPGTSWYGTYIPAYPLGNRTYYYIDAVDLSGNRVVLPETATDNFTSEYDYYKARFEGKASFILLLLHIVLMVAALFLLIHALYYAMYYIRNGEKETHIIKSVNVGILAFFITGFPIGCVIEKQVLGNYWEGFPFGTDITDSKTLVILLIFVVFMYLQKKGKISMKGYSWSVIINTIITIILFLLPHSL